ncbi:MAG: VPLPA-CTERM sorting domain-containing protein [Paracoccaceae bacterium]
MSIFGRTAILAATSLFVASTAFASTVSITAADIDNRGDDVVFSIANNGNQAISMITFDVSQAAGVSAMARFNIPSNLSDGDGISNEGDTGSFQFINTDSDAQAEQLKWTFDGAGLGAGSTFDFSAWIQYLNDETASGQKGGLDDDGDRLFATVVFADGTSQSSFFTSLGAQASVGSASLDFTPAPVPLPASALLLMGGIAGLGVMRRRKKTA